MPIFESTKTSFRKYYFEMQIDRMFHFYLWKDTICWMENIFWKFFIHKEVFALKADCANLFKLIKENFVDWKIFRWTDL